MLPEVVDISGLGVDVVFTDKSIGTSTDMRCFGELLLDLPFRVLSVLRYVLHYESYNY